MKIVLILIAYTLIYFIWQKQKKLSAKLDMIEKDDFKTLSISTPHADDATSNKEEVEHLLRYRIRMWLLPNRENLIKNFSQSVGMPYDKYLEYFEKNKNLEIDYQESIFYALNGFGYIIFMDKGMEQIWSEKSKTFVNEIEVRGQMFSVKFSEQMKLVESPYKQAIAHLVATPNQLGFAHWARGVDQEKILATIPFDKIVTFFKDLYGHEGEWPCKCAIKSFSKELVNELNKYNVTYNKLFMEDYGVGCSEKDFNYKNLELYSDWAKNNNIEVYDQILKFHQFDTEYYSILINFEFYE